MSKLLSGYQKFKNTSFAYSVYKETVKDGKIIAMIYFHFYATHQRKSYIRMEEKMISKVLFICVNSNKVKNDVRTLVTTSVGTLAL